MRNILRKLILSLIVLFLLTAPLFSGGRGESKGEIVVGSKIDTEGALLGNMIVLALENGGYKVVDKSQTGATNIVRSALIAGEIDIYPEYTGNAFFFFPNESEEEIWKDFRAGYEKAKALDLVAHNIVWLAPAPANNTWAIAVRRDMAVQENLETLEDLALYINRGGVFKLAASEEFVSSEAALPSFEQHYGFVLTQQQLLVFAGGNTTLTEQAAASGQEGVNAAMAYGTDGQLAALDLKILTDTLSIQPVYAPSAIVRGDILERFPEIKSIIEPIFESLDLEVLQRLNSQIAVEGLSPREVALAYLSQRGFL